jgi:hypothetical protein
MPSRAKALGHGSICRAKALGLTGRCEPLHATLPWPRGPMGVLTPMIEVATLPVCHPWPYLACRATVAFELIRHDAAWHTPQALEPPANARFRGLRLGLTWHQDLPDMVVLIDDPPQVMAFAVHGQNQCIHMPSIRCPRGGVAGDAAMGIVSPELLTPWMAGFIGHVDAAFARECLHVAVAQVNAIIAPRPVADDGAGKPAVCVALGGDGRGHVWLPLLGWHQSRMGHHRGEYGIRWQGGSTTGKPPRTYRSSHSAAARPP